MILEVEVKRLLKEYISQREECPENWEKIKKELETFADWLDNLDIEKVIGNR